MTTERALGSVDEPLVEAIQSMSDDALRQRSPRPRRPVGRLRSGRSRARRCLSILIRATTTVDRSVT